MYVGNIRHECNVGQCKKYLHLHSFACRRLLYFISATALVCNLTGRTFDNLRDMRDDTKVPGRKIRVAAFSKLEEGI